MVLLAVAVLAAVHYVTRPPAYEFKLSQFIWPEIGQVDESNTGTTLLGSGSRSSLTDRWPQFRGADRTNRAPGGGPILGFDVIWVVDAVSEGHSGPAVANGCVYIMDYDYEHQLDLVRCLSLGDGAEVWRHSYYVPLEPKVGISRTVPAVTDEFVVTIGPAGHVRCLRAMTGELVWSLDMVVECGTRIQPWNTGQCPLVSDKAVILAPGANPLMMAVDMPTGRRLWETRTQAPYGMTHSSIISTHFGYMYTSSTGLVGVSHEGKLLWTFPEWQIPMANIPVPVQVTDSRWFLSAGYRVGCMMIEVRPGGPVEIWRKGLHHFSTEQHSPFIVDGHIYGIRKWGRLVCMDLDGNLLWESDQAVEERFGFGPYVMLGEQLLILVDSTCELKLVNISPDGYEVVLTEKVLDGADAWAPMAVAGDLIVLRSSTQIACVRIIR